MNLFLMFFHAWSPWEEQQVNGMANVGGLLKDQKWIDAHWRVQRRHCRTCGFIQEAKIGND